MAIGCLALWVLAACSALPVDRSSPLRVRNQHPVQLTAIHAEPRPARPTGPGAIDVGFRLDWTSLWLVPGRGADQIRLDGEILRTSVDFRFGLLPNLDVEVGLPLLHASGGLLDSFIEGWHDFFQFGQAGRDDFPRDRYTVEALRRRSDGLLVPAYRLEEDGIHLGDVPVFLTWFPTGSSDEGFTFGLRGGVELPTGDEREGFGNGGLDGNIGFLAEYGLPVSRFFAWGGYSVLHDAETAEDLGLDASNIAAVGLGIEFALHRDLSAIAQVEWEESVLGRLDDSHADRDQALLWVGGRYRFSDRSDLEFGLGEDLLDDVSPDVTFHLGMNFRL